MSTVRKEQKRKSPSKMTKSSASAPKRRKLKPKRFTRSSDVLEPIFELAIPHMGRRTKQICNLEKMNVPFKWKGQSIESFWTDRDTNRIGMSHGIRAVIKSSRIKQSLPTTRILPFEYKIHFVFCALHLRFLNYQIDLRQATRRNRKRFSPI
ncbi:unnamed protein product, partial [Nesidiocoris tenuis]